MSRFCVLNRRLVLTDAVCGEEKHRRVRGFFFLKKSEINCHTGMDLDSMKYAELRSLAKELGLKANMKVRKRYF